MWTCQNCGYNDETGDTFEEELDDDGEVLRYCPECGSDEVLRSDEGEDEDEEYYAGETEVKWGSGGERDDDW